MTGLSFLLKRMQGKANYPELYGENTMLSEAKTSEYAY